MHIVLPICHIRWCPKLQVASWSHCVFIMGFQRKILGKRTTIPASEAVVPQMAELRSLKLKRAREDENEEARQLSPTGNEAGTQRSLHCPPAPKKPRLVLGCSLDGFKVLSVMDLRCFLR